MIDIGKQNDLLFTCSPAGELSVKVKSRGDFLHYVIGFFPNLRTGRTLLKSCSFYGASNCRVVSYRYFFRLTDLLAAGKEDESLLAFLFQLEQRLIAELILKKLDSLAVYALLHNIPGMRKYLDKPILLAIAAENYRILETLDDIELADFRLWLPGILGVNKLTKGLERAIAKIDVGDTLDTASAARTLAMHYTAISRPVSRSRRIRCRSLELMRALIENNPEAADAKWLCCDIFDHSDSQAVGFNYEHTKQMLQTADNTNWNRILLKQIRSFNELVRLHDRLSDKQRRNHRLPRDTAFITHDVPEDDNLKLVRNSGELVDVANKLHNCAAIFVDDCREGRLVHLYYDAGDDSALLQLSFETQAKAEVREYSGICNQPPSGRARSVLERWLSSCLT